MQTSIFRTATLAGLVFCASLLGCGGGGGGYGDSSSSSPPMANGMLGVALTDAPGCGFSAVNVTVSKVRVHQSVSASENDAGWVDLTLASAQRVNLLDLTNGVLLSLGQVPLPAGHYSQVRLVLSANSAAAPFAESVVVLGGAEVALDTPSAIQSGIKLLFDFDVMAGARFDLVLDFDACSSVVARGNGAFSLKPVIRAVPSQVNGISGFVDASLLSANVAISAQQAGKVMAATIPTQTGEFFLAHLAPGSYDLVIAADGRTTVVITAIPVASTTSNVAVSSAGVAIVPPASASNSAGGVVTLSPASADTAVYVSALQTLAGGAVNVRTRAANLSTGVYSLTLATAAPLVGAYGSGTLPIALGAQATAAGKYTLSAAASGYVTKTSAIDVSGVVPVVVDFTLTP